MSQPPPDLFPERPVRSDFARAEYRRFRWLRPPSYRARRILTVSIAVFVLLLILRAVFGGPSALPPGEIPVIKAAGSWKQRPQQPGGLEIPNQNVQVYQSLDSKDAAKAQAEHLLPPPEVPQPVAASAPGAPPAVSPPSKAPAVEDLTPPKLSIDTIPTTVTPATPTPAAPSAPAPAAAPPAPVQAAAVPSVSAAAPAASPGPASPPAHVTEQRPAEKKPVEKSKSPRTIAQVLKDVETAPKTDRIVQLASVSDEATARAMEEKLQARYAAILGSARLRLVKAEIPGKGVFYRIQSQPIPGEHASGICAAIKRMKAGCILVRP